ncbi:MAG: helix-hairpin-helix domain-containing protein [Blastocatellia bacterium]|nr:helix-hairpin-helix domain-containing protein [Blastocatellia bacterium]
MSDSSQERGDRPLADNREVVRVLATIASLLEFRDDNPFKVRSYRLAAETIEEMPQPLSEMVAGGKLTELQKIPGVGKSISAQIAEILLTGTSRYFEQLRQEIPETVLELFRVSGIGLKTAQSLYRDFGIKSLQDLKAFAEGDGLLSVSGLGEKAIIRIKNSLARLA